MEKKENKILNAIKRHAVSKQFKKVEGEIADNVNFTFEGSQWRAFRKLKIDTVSKMKCIHKSSDSQATIIEHDKKNELLEFFDVPSAYYATTNEYGKRLHSYDIHTTEVYGKEWSVMTASLVDDESGKNCSTFSPNYIQKVYLIGHLSEKGFSFRQYLVEHDKDRECSKITINSGRRKCYFEFDKDHQILDAHYEFNDKEQSYHRLRSFKRAMNYYDDIMSQINVTHYENCKIK